MVGHLLLETPLLNKGSAFSADERRTFGLQGLLPPHIASLEEQLARTYENYQQQITDLEPQRPLQCCRRLKAIVRKS